MKPKVIICPNGITKFFNPDGTRNENNPSGFAFPGCREWFISNGFEIIEYK